jgi:hypothetical protein
MARITSGASAVSSAACLRIWAASGVAQRASMRTLRPMVQPNCPSSCRNAPNPGLKFRIIRGCVQEYADLPHTSRLLRMRRERPRHRRAAEKRNELAASDHSITSSASASSLSGTVRPSIRAVEALMTNSNFEDCTTGRSAGFAPLRM